MTDPILTPEEIEMLRECDDMSGYGYVLTSHEALRARAAELEGAIARLYVVACPGWASDGTATNMLANIERRAAEDAATIARLDREVVNLQIERSQSDRALATLREATTWQPMETAPKDGRAILVRGVFAGEINGPDNEPSVGVASWLGGRGDYPGFDWVAEHTDAYA